MPQYGFVSGFFSFNEIQNSGNRDYFLKLNKLKTTLRQESQTPGATVT